MKKSVRIFGILRGKMLLPFTIRASRRSAIDHYLIDHEYGHIHRATPKEFKELFPNRRVVPVDAFYEA